MFLAAFAILRVLQVKQKKRARDGAPLGESKDCLGLEILRDAPILALMTEAVTGSIFHLAIPVHDLEAAREFYGNTLGCPEGRSSDTWVDFNFYGHQIVAHLDPEYGKKDKVRNLVDEEKIPVPHFGLILEWKSWHTLRDGLISAAVIFTVGPYIRFKELPGEQATMFICDPSGNAIEFKSFKNPARLFAK